MPRKSEAPRSRIIFATRVSRTVRAFYNCYFFSRALPSSSSTLVLVWIDLSARRSGKERIWKNAWEGGGGRVRVGPRDKERAVVRRIIPFPEFDDAPPAPVPGPGAPPMIKGDAGERGTGARVGSAPASGGAKLRFQISYFPASWPVLKT